MPGEDVKHCWDTTIQETEDGWLQGPFTLDEAWEKGARILLTRFAHHEADKIRLCDNGVPLNVCSDISSSMPIPSVHHALALASSSAILLEEGGPPRWVIDIANAYKNVSISKAGSATNWIGVFDPKAKAYKAFRGLTLLFGNIHSVTEWLIVGQFLAFCVRWFFCVALIIYIDDMTGTAPRRVRRLLMRAIVYMLEVLGFPWKPKKVKWGRTALRVLGLDFDVSQSPPTMQLSEVKRATLRAALVEVLGAGELSPARASTLSGKFLF
ncbi:unnamed protein product, partial [Amoebophrya sp. A120]|eukprot:GSA120T00026256001.1